MHKYTLCFIKQGNRMLMLNRRSAPNMGLWNGVGGKIETGEFPHASVLREIAEETGITFNHVTYKGVVSWLSDTGRGAGMYVYIGELPDQVIYETPRKVEEGILDWKELSWVFAENNLGVGDMIPLYLSVMMSDKQLYQHKFVLGNKGITAYERSPINGEHENDEGGPCL